MSTPLHDQFVHMFFSLLTMVAIIVILAYLYKRYGSRLVGSNRELKILSTLPVGSKEKLLLVQVGEEQLLVGVTAHNISPLHQLNTPITPRQEVTNTEDTPRSFKNILAGLKK